jgi:CspA family cold shock protein
MFGGRNAFIETPRIGFPMRFNAPRHSFQQQTPVAEKIKATVKWFDPNKGFGFVAPEDGSPDAFLPAAAVTAVGHDRLPEGSTVVVDLVQGQKGNQVSRIYDVDVSTASPRPRRDDAARPAPRAGAAPRSPYGNDRGGYGGGNDRSYGAGPSEEIEGVVKWFNTTKGFGFVAPDTGGKDVFVHITAVERSGIGALQENQRVRMKVQQGQKGLEAVSIETL